MIFNGRALICTFSGTQVRIAEIERLQSVKTSTGLPMWGAWCKTLVGGFSLGEWEPLCPRPTLPEAACNTAGGLGGAVSPPAGSGRERILALMYIKFASNNVPGKISVQKKNPLWGAPNCGGPGAAAPFAPLLIRHWLKPHRVGINNLYTSLLKP